MSIPRPVDPVLQDILDRLRLAEAEPERFFELFPEWKDLSPDEVRGRWGDAIALFEASLSPTDSYWKFKLDQGDP